MSKEERGWLLVIFVSLCAAILLSIVGCKPAHKEHERMELEVLIFPLIHTPDDDLIHFNIFLDDEESDAQE